MQKWAFAYATVLGRGAAADETIQVVTTGAVLPLSPANRINPAGSGGYESRCGGRP